MAEASSASGDAPHKELGEEVLNGEPNVPNLWSISTVEEAVGKFGFAPGDRIPRRDQIKIYDRVQEAISSKKVGLIAAGRYEDVVRLQGTLCDLKRQFQQLQLKDVEKDQTKQRSLYRTAKKKYLTSVIHGVQSAGRRVEDMCAFREVELEQLHQAQRETLELGLGWMPQPRMKYTNRCLELQKAKAGLVRLHQYKDAQTVQKVLSKLQPVEEGAFLAAYNAQKALKRRMLEKRQVQDSKKMHKMLTDVQLRDERERVKTIENVKRKLEHSERSMTHAHYMALLRRPELSQNPSAHWQRRAHYALTAASLRGEQFSKAVKGKASGSAVKVADLTSIHQFSVHLDGTVTTYKSPASTVDHCTTTIDHRI